MMNFVDAPPCIWDSVMSEASEAVGLDFGTDLPEGVGPFALQRAALPPFERDLEVSFQWKNPDLLIRNPDFLLKDVEFIMYRRFVSIVCSGRRCCRRSLWTLRRSCCFAGRTFRRARRRTGGRCMHGSVGR